MQKAKSRSLAVTVDGVSKTFRIPSERRLTLKERALNPFSRPNYRTLQALRDVSFTVEKGEFFGIVGRNGSGKSTLLKCLGGIYQTDTGSIRMDGRLSTFIELGVGFNFDLPARDNVLINGIMLGLSPKEALRRFDRIVEFAELEDFVELKLKNYSSGMQVRLAFSVMVHVDADILLIDEVLAVGDASFQQKCFDEFHRLRDEGKTILFVSHDMGSVKRFCDRALLLEQGETKQIGDTEAVSNHYFELNFDRERSNTNPTETERLGNQTAEIVEAWFESHDSERTQQLAQGETYTFFMRIAFHQRLCDPVVAFVLENDNHQTLFATSNEDSNLVTGEHHAGDEAIFSVSFTNVFAPTRVFASPWIVHPGGAILDHRVRLISAVVTSTRRSGGIVDLPNHANYQRHSSALTVPT